MNRRTSDNASIMLTSELPKSSRVSGRACFNLPQSSQEIVPDTFSFIYPDGSSRPINPGPNGQWNDDEYFARKRSEEAQRRLFESRSSFEPPQTQGPTTFYGPGGKMTLCYPGFNNTMYCN